MCVCVLVYLQAQKSNMLTPDMLLDVKHVRRKHLTKYLPPEITESLKNIEPPLRHTVRLVVATSACYLSSTRCSSRSVILSLFLFHLFNSPYDSN